MPAKLAKNKKIYLMIASHFTGMEKKDWLEQMPELKIIADLEPVLVFNNQAADISPTVWLKLASEVYQRLDSAIGFIVLHSLDNLLYSASALSFLLQNLNRPIIFTGGLLGYQANKNLEVRSNLINASQTIIYQVPEVTLIFGNRLIRANQALRLPDESLNIFEAPDNSILGRIDFSIRIYDRLIFKSSGKVKLTQNLNSKIEIIQLSPFLNLKNLSRQAAELNGLIINAGSYEHLPQDLLIILEKITTDLPVLIWSKKITATTFMPKNIILINQLIWETAVTKFFWVLSQTDNLKKIKELMHKELAGEFMN
ncbi:MAG: hypothetical protein A2729_05185 [Candidatus Buchananbacteria bacterium RIFCSPHIGHO2_01_FULL_39_14]|uniref:L-asparaginase N-terminal domain-containing protein n=2 Tax=Candidatus Buchananiibacteriota TaxID=1817903 RepID=A0A1G1YSQ6_9BACT|nr:MAG: hypothetical protein A2729_05185 [Candidatus Buchananbacteria bacterium RIFCSPHIGHO2_01_FULL_39_14]OGY48105.1 MAG: hypothetical protein A3D39_03555 [Candidatus Buchananbacteria bacterium RIFCSPHIGHO2_02_FULL_39_17]OGY54457.1 MAG: hypothetical protein A2912_05690 [Candidatus Buchananbacteria bacterium RIFCSPLOWO2_01_FULL_40_23b]